MVPMSVEEIAKAVDGRLVAGDGPAIEATETVTDSRQAGSGAVFVAIKGERVDGHDFVDKVAAQGAAAAIVDHEVACTTMPQIDHRNRRLRDAGFLAGIIRCVSGNSD